MKVLELTEYRGDGKFYPLLVAVGATTFSVFTVELQPAGPTIIGQSKSLGTGAMLIGAVPGKNLVVKESLKEIVKLLRTP